MTHPKEERRTASEADILPGVSSKKRGLISNGAVFMYYKESTSFILHTPAPPGSQYEVYEMAPFLRPPEHTDTGRVRYY